MTRRRPLRRVFHRARSWALRHTLLASLPFVCCVMAVNAGVRAAGGDVHVLSLRRLGERAEALRLLAGHTLRCAEGDAEAELALREAALRHGIPVRLALSVAHVESSLIHTRISGTGAMGLMQLMPATARELGVSDPFDVHQSADGGARYLRQLLTSYRGDVRRALAAYNTGPARVPLRGPMTLSAQTRTYVARVVSRL